MRICGCTGLSDIGAVRHNNEDRWFADPRIGLFIVADGMGGHAAGEVAAQRVVDGLPRVLSARVETLAGRSDWRLARTLAAAIRTVNKAIRKEAQLIAGLRDMGTTLVLALIRSEAAIVANVGDSRAYLFRGGEVHLLTYDHTLAQFLLDHGLISADDPRILVARQELLQCMGMQGTPLPWIAKVTLASGDRLLLCSDGLTDMVSAGDISGVLRREPDAFAACAALIRMANLAGGRDNITVLLVNFGE